MFGLTPSIRKLVMPDLNQAVEMYARAFRYDPYFTQQFHENDAYQFIKDFYTEDIQNTIIFGIAYGMFDSKGKMIGEVLGINPMDWDNNHREALDSLFNSNEVETDAWCDYMIQHFRKINRRVLYIYGLVVDPEKQCRGYGTKLVKYMIQKYGDTHTIIGDPTADIAIQLWLKNGFHKDMMGTVAVVVRD